MRTGRNIKLLYLKAAHMTVRSMAPSIPIQQPCPEDIFNMGKDRDCGNLKRDDSVVLDLQISLPNEPVRVFFLFLPEHF